VWLVGFEALLRVTIRYRRYPLRLAPLMRFVLLLGLVTQFAALLATGMHGTEHCIVER